MGIRLLATRKSKHRVSLGHRHVAVIPLLSVARFLGHKSTIMTERYAHLAPEHLSEEMNRVEKWHQEGTSSNGPETKRSGSIRNSRPS
jgi:integrase